MYINRVIFVPFYFFFIFCPFLFFVIFIFVDTQKTIWLQYMYFNITTKTTHWGIFAGKELGLRFKGRGGRVFMSLDRSQTINNLIIPLATLPTQGHIQGVACNVLREGCYSEGLSHGTGDKIVVRIPHRGFQARVLLIWIRRSTNYTRRTISNEIEGCQITKGAARSLKLTHTKVYIATPRCVFKFTAYTLLYKNMFVWH